MLGCTSQYARWQRRAGLLPVFLLVSQAASVIADDRNANSVFLDDILPILQIAASFAFAGLLICVAAKRRGRQPDEYEQLLNTQRAADAFITSLFGILALGMVALFIDYPGSP